MTTFMTDFTPSPTEPAPPRIVCHAALTHTLREAISAAFSLMDRTYKTAKTQGIELTYAFNYHGMEVPMSPASASYDNLAKLIKEAMRLREIEHATTPPTPGLAAITVAPPTHTGTQEDAIWCRNAILAMANSFFEVNTYDLSQRFYRYGINVQGRPTEVNPWEMDWQRHL